MRIAWFTPFNKQSAIGKYSKIATDNLNKVAKVDLFLFQKEDLWESDLKKIYYDKDSELTTKLNTYDIVIYNLGDYLPYHEAIYEQSRKYRGTIIIHDLVLHNFFRGYYLLNKEDTQLYLNELYRLYGEEVCSKAQRFLGGLEKTPFWETEEVLKATFAEKGTEYCSGIITHSHYLTNHLKKIYDGPIKTIYFPFVQDGVNITNVNLDALKKNKINIITVGNVNPNKRIHKMIEVIGKNKDIHDKVNYIIIGSLGHEQYIKEIRELIKQFKLENTVKLLGRKSDEELFMYLKEADVACNLRYPAIEGASWSLIEQMSFGKPVIVTDNGFYSEMPDDAVCKVNPENEDQDIYKILKDLCKKEKKRKDIGNRAKKLCEEEFSPKLYADKFIEFSKELIFHTPLNRIIDKTTQEMMIMDLSSNMNVIKNISKEMQELFY